MFSISICRFVISFSHVISEYQWLEFGIALVCVTQWILRGNWGCYEEVESKKYVRLKTLHSFVVHQNIEIHQNGNNAVFFFLSLADTSNLPFLLHNQLKDKENIHKIYFKFLKATGIWDEVFFW